MADTEALTRRYIAAINDREWPVITQMLGEGAVHHYTGGEAEGPGEIVSLYQSMCDQLGWKIEIHAIATTESWSATLHRNQLSVGNFDVSTAARLEDGRIVELWTNGMPPLPAG
ncbi:MAG TPA: nuclear transport factor 2 family protein [Acidimicrobiales bacterium]|nr:nuclear transport factor 2 family protein [Acidimicrobiales bacterium]